MIAKDKLLHFFFGFVITWISCIILMYVKMPTIYGLLLSVVVGAAKEIVWDKILGKGKMEAMDFVFTCIGGIIAFMVQFLL